MKNKYFLNDGKKQSGLLNFEEISKMQLKETDMVWVEGAENWKVITEFEELKPFVIKMPPPIPKSDKRSKFIAREIKVNFKLVLLAFVIGICSYPTIAYVKGGFKSLSYQAKFKSLFKENNISNFTTDTSTAEPNIPFEKKRDNLISEVESFIPLEDLVYFDVRSHFNVEKGMYDNEKHFDYPASLDNNIKRSFGVDSIFLSVMCFFLTSILLIFGRYLINALHKSINWVNENSSK